MGKACSTVTGILSGNQIFVNPSEMEQVDGLFAEARGGNVIQPELLRRVR
jgi:hypothetical protein